MSEIRPPILLGPPITFTPPSVADLRLASPAEIDDNHVALNQSPAEPSVGSAVMGRKASLEVPLGGLDRRSSSPGRPPKRSSSLRNDQAKSRHQEAEVDPSSSEMSHEVSEKTTHNDKPKQEKILAETTENRPGKNELLNLPPPPPFNLAVTKLGVGIPERRVSTSYESLRFWSSHKLMGFN
jgi:hypothetical protein